MKALTAIIRRHRATATKAELSRIGCRGYTLFSALGRGQQRGVSSGNGDQGHLGFLPRLVLQLVVEEAQVDETVEAIIRGNQTGEFGDGRIFVIDLDAAHRISDASSSGVAQPEEEAATMKMIQAIIRPEKEEALTRRLDQANLPAMTKWSVLGRGRQQGIQVGGTIYSELAKLCVMMVVKEADVPTAVQAISEAAKTGSPGDGRIFVSDVKQAYTIRTGERIS